MTKTEVDSLKKKLNWFIGIAIMLFLGVMQNSWSNSGFKKEIKAEIKTVSSKLDIYIDAEKEKSESMKDILNEVRLQARDMQNQGIEAGWYRPTIITRDGKIID